MTKKDIIAYTGNSRRANTYRQNVPKGVFIFMYSENQRNTCARRANDEFLRRMLGGELAGNGDASRSGACGT